MSKVQGTVQDITSRDWKDTKMWSIKVDGKFYGTGLTKPKCSVGDAVEFEVSQNGKYLNVEGPVTVLTGAAAAPVQQVAQSRQQADDDRQRSINYQSSRKDALSMVQILTSAGAIKLPAKQPAQVDALLALVDELTDRYNRDIVDVVKHGERRAAGADRNVEDADGEDEDQF